MKFPIHELKKLITKTMSTTQITKIAFCLIIALSTLACKKENQNPSGAGAGLSPSAANTRFEQVLNVQINGTNWTAASNIFGGVSTLVGTTTTSIDGRKTNTSGRRERFNIGMTCNPTIGNNYNVKSFSGLGELEYNNESYVLSYYSGATEKSHMNIQVLNIIQDPLLPELKYIAADFRGVIYNIANSSDSVTVSGSIRFK